MATIGYRIGYDNLQAQVEALQATQNQIQTAATVSALPDPSTLPDGTLAAVLVASANGLPSILVTHGGQWKLPLEAFPPSISFVATPGGGGGSLAVGAGVSAPVGTGFALDPSRSFARPSGIAVLPLDPVNITLGPNGSGLWRVAVQLNYDSPSGIVASQTRFFLQRDGGVGYADVAGGELVRLDQDPLSTITGLTQVGLALNLTLAAADKLRVVLRHNAITTRTYTVNEISYGMNQIGATPT